MSVRQWSTPLMSYRWHHLPIRGINDLCHNFCFNLLQSRQRRKWTQKKLQTIVCILMIIHHFIVLYHRKFRSQRSIPDFKRREWSNGEKNQNPQNSLYQKLTHKIILYRSTHHQDSSVQVKQTKKNYMPNFPTQKESRHPDFKPNKSFDDRHH